MHRRFILSLLFVSLVLFGGRDTAFSATSSRELAPWVMTVIPPVRDETDAYSGPRELKEVTLALQGLDWTPNYYPTTATLKEIGQQVIFRRNVWCFEFSFKPVRMLRVEVPTTGGKTEPKLIWYMVYRVRNVGYHQQPTAKPDQFGHELYETKPVNHTIRFFPRLILEGHELNKAYLDRVIPAAVRDIQEVEDPNGHFMNSVEISQVDIPVSTDQEDHSVWGVATWEDVDPRIDFFSVYVHGLTNAFRWETASGDVQPGQPARSANLYQRKTLQLNFWRPGDTVRQHQDEVRFGMPAFEDVQGTKLESPEQLQNLYHVDRQRDYEWVFR